MPTQNVPVRFSPPLSYSGDRGKCGGVIKVDVLCSALSSEIRQVSLMSDGVRATRYIQIIAQIPLQEKHCQVFS